MDVTNTYYPAEGSFHGYGTQLMVGDNASSPEEFEAVAEVRSIRFGEMVTANFDRTHLRSPDAHTELLAALRSSGAFSCTLNWRPSHESQSNAGGGTGSFISGGLLAIWRSRELRNYKIVLSDASPPTEIPFTGFISRYQPGEIGATAGPDLTVEFQPKDGAWHADLP